MEQKSAKKWFFSSTLWKSKFHYVEQLWNCLFHTVEQSLDQSTRNSTLWNFWLERHKAQFHTMEQSLRFQVRGLSHATVLWQALASSEPHYICWYKVGLLSIGFNPISAGGGEIHLPPGFSLAIATKINLSTPNVLTFNFYYWDIIWPKIKFITCQGVTWSLFCLKHFASPHIFHCIFTEFSCYTFSFFWHLDI